MTADNAFTIAAVGDISLGDHPVCVGHGMRKAFANHGPGLLSDVREYWAGSDVVMGNLETVASDIGLKPGKLSSFEMRGDPAALNSLKQAGFNVLNLANNHALQHGREAFDDTIARLRETGIEPLGLEADPNGAGLVKSAPLFFDKVGKQHVFLGYSIRPEEWTDGAIPYSYRDSFDSILSEVSEARRNVNGAVVVSMHWGLEYLDYPGPEQIELGRKLVDAGADLIIGHHPHVLQPHEYYKHGLILYSLGNFLFDLWHPETWPTTVALITITEGSAPRVDFKPVHIDSRFFPRKADTHQGETVRRLLSFDGQSVDSILKLAPEEYRDVFRANLAMLRPRKYRYFVRNIYRYPPGIILQSFFRTFYRRLTGT